MKICMKCGAEKPLTDFYKHPKMKDGRVNKCKECNKKDVKENRAAKIDYYREYDTKRFQNDPKIKERHLRYRQTESGKAAHRKAREKWQSNNEDKRAAHILLGNAVRSGRLSRPSECSKCGATGRIHGHHEDYTKPLDVVWVCQSCHVKIHRET